MDIRRTNLFRIFEFVYKEKYSEMLTPVKTIKDQSSALKQWDKATNDLFSRTVSAVRQPIEYFFDLIIEKADIPRVSKLKSTNGLKVPVFGNCLQLF